MHQDNLHICLRRGGIYAPNHTPADGLTYKVIHNMEIQSRRQRTAIPCGPGGTIHDYVSFYFGFLSPMLLQLKTGQVRDYAEGQEPLIYLIATAQDIQQHGTRFVFADGHGLASFTQWYNDLRDLDKVDWTAVNLRYWADTQDDKDRQRRKQAEFLIYQFCDWSLIREIVVMNAGIKTKSSRFCSNTRRRLGGRSGSEGIGTTIERRRQ